jgi:hypothetical protein
MKVISEFIIKVLPSDKCIAVFKVGVEVGLIDDGAGLGFDARLLVRQRQLVEHVDVGEGVGQSNFFGHFVDLISVFLSQIVEQSVHVKSF